MYSNLTFVLIQVFAYEPFLHLVGKLFQTTCVLRSTSCAFAPCCDVYALYVKCKRNFWTRILVLLMLFVSTLIILVRNFPRMDLCNSFIFCYWHNLLCKPSLSKFYRLLCNSCDLTRSLPNELKECSFLLITVYGGYRDRYMRLLFCNKPAIYYQTVRQQEVH